MSTPDTSYNWLLSRLGIRSSHYSFVCFSHTCRSSLMDAIMNYCSGSGLQKSIFAAANVASRIISQELYDSNRLLLQNEN